jgi:nucleotide-binding universal stress UspA family protein
MNTIVVPTDFSAAAENATAYAAQLAKQTNALVLLLHVYQLPVPMADYPVLMVTNEDLKKGADTGLQQAMEEAQKRYADVTFETESRLGDVATEVEEFCKERNALALVVGTKDHSGFERLLFGDTTASLIKHCSYPLIAVPEGAKKSVPANIVLATDLLNVDEIPAERIVSITKLLNADLHVVHVEVKDEKTASPESLLEKLRAVNATYHSVQEEDVTEGIRHYVEQNKVDLVLVLPHKHNFYERLFFKGHTQGILHGVSVPVMSLRND